VRTYAAVGEALEATGREVRFVTPDAFRAVPCPTYPSIRLALFPRRGVREQLRAFEPDAVHIATEGPLEQAARAICRREGVSFTTSFHTRFPEYIRARAPLPVELSYRYLRRFHGRAVRTSVPTASQRQRDRLLARGFRNLEIRARGVDTSVLRPGPKFFLDAPRPLSMYVGRVAVEKNIEAFLSLDLPGTKYVVGDGPDLRKLRRACPALPGRRRDPRGRASARCLQLPFRPHPARVLFHRHGDRVVPGALLAAGAVHRAGRALAASAGPALSERRGRGRGPRAAHRQRPVPDLSAGAGRYPTARLAGRRGRW